MSTPRYTRPFIHAAFDPRSKSYPWYQAQRIRAAFAPLTFWTTLYTDLLRLAFGLPRTPGATR